MNRFCAAALILVVALSVANCEDEEEYVTVRYKDCKSQFEVVSVEASQCPLEKNKCLFKRGSEPRIRIGFKPDRDVEKLRTTVQARLGEAFVPFHLDNDDTCDGNNVTCPLKAGEVYYYSQTVKILKEYPLVDVQVNWVLKDTSKQEEKSGDPSATTDRKDVCIIFLAHVQEP